MGGTELNEDRDDFPNVTDFSILPLTGSKKLLAFELLFEESVPISTY